GRAPNAVLRLTRTRDPSPFAGGLRRLERNIVYPIADGAEHFFIDHGEDYAAFFRALGTAHFLLAHIGDELVGTFCGVERPVRIGEETLPAAYLCDLKLAHGSRGRGIPRRMGLRALQELLTDPGLWRTRLVYGAAMRGDRGDVMRSVRGVHPGKLLGPQATLQLFFVPPATLAALPEGGPGVPHGVGLELSPRAPDGLGVVSTAGRKDLRLVNAARDWPLQHLTACPAQWTDGIGTWLRRCGAALQAKGARGEACFALDARLSGHLEWLAGQGLVSGARCTVYAMWLTLPRRFAWVHLATSEI
ncbi:MAG: GNAT family N-acetyltransferase, partial [Myxococcales bacterium]